MLSETQFGLVFSAVAAAGGLLGWLFRSVTTTILASWTKKTDAEVLAVQQHATANEMVAKAIVEMRLTQVTHTGQILERVDTHAAKGLERLDQVGDKIIEEVTDRRIVALVNGKQPSLPGV